MFNIAAGLCPQIIVTKGSGKILPGSTGYIMPKCNLNSKYNNFTAWIIFTRFGNNGKPRVYPIEIKSNIVPFEELDSNQISEEEYSAIFHAINLKHKFIEAIKNVNGEVIKLISMDNVENYVSDIADLESHEFLGKIAALTIFTNSIFRELQIGRITNRAQLGVPVKKIMATDDLNLSIVEPLDIGEYILYKLQKDIDSKTNTNEIQLLKYIQNYSDRQCIANRILDYYPYIAKTLYEEINSFAQSKIFITNYLQEKILGNAQGNAEQNNVEQDNYKYDYYKAEIRKNIKLNRVVDQF